MKEIKSGEYVLNKINNVVYEYVCYREDIKLHVVSSIHNNAILNEMLNYGYYEINDEDIVFGIDNIIKYLNSKINKLRAQIKKKTKEMEKPLDFVIGKAKVNTLKEEIFALKKRILKESLSIEEEKELHKIVNEKESELSKVELRLNNDLFKQITINQIESNNELIEKLKTISNELKKIAKEKKEIVVENITKENEFIIELEKIICNQNVHYRVVNQNEEDDVVMHNDIATLVVINDEPCMAISFSHMVDNGDYDYEDEYIPNYEEITTYEKIYFSPINGKKYIFNIVKTSDISDEYNAAMKIYNKFCNRKRMKKEEHFAFDNAKAKIEFLMSNFILEVEE